MAWPETATPPPDMPKQQWLLMERPYTPTIMCRCRRLDAEPDDPGFILGIRAEMVLNGELFLWGTRYDDTINTLADDEIPDERHVHISLYEFWFRDDGRDVFLRGDELISEATMTPLPGA